MPIGILSNDQLCARDRFVFGWVQKKIIFFWLVKKKIINQWIYKDLFCNVLFDHILQLFKFLIFLKKNISRVSSILDGYTYITRPISFQCMFEKFGHNIIWYFVVAIIVLMLILFYLFFWLFIGYCPVICVDLWTTFGHKGIDRRWWCCTLRRKEGLVIAHASLPKKSLVTYCQGYQSNLWSDFSVYASPGTLSSRKSTQTDSGSCTHHC